MLGCNMFCYCLNNSVNRFDDSGHFWNIIIGAVVGTVVGAVSAAISGDNVWVGAAAGLVTGTIAGATLGVGTAVGGALGLGIATLGGAAGSATGEVIREIGNNEQLNPGKIATEAVIGGLSNSLSFGIGNLLSNGFPAKEIIRNSKGHVCTVKTMASNFLKQTAAETIANSYLTMFIVSPLQLSSSILLNQLF